MTTAASSQDRTEIEALILDEVSAWNRGDAAAFAARTLPDVVFTNVVGRFTIGREPFFCSTSTFFRPSTRQVI